MAAHLDMARFYRKGEQTGGDQPEWHYGIDHYPAGGVYIFFTTRSKMQRNTLVKAKKTSSFTSIAAATFTLLWTFSGTYHALAKFQGKTTGSVLY